MSSFEKIIGDALFSGDHDLGIARAAVKYAVQRAIFCPECNCTLDQKDAVYLETVQEKPAGVMCRKCTDAALDKLPDDLNLGFIRYTWEGIERVNC